MEVVDQIPAAVYVAEAVITKGSISFKKINFVNNWIKNLTGYSKEEIIPNQWERNIPEEDREKPYTIENATAYKTFRFRRKDGGYVRIRDTLKIIERQGNHAHITGIWIEEKREEEEEIFNAVDKAPAVGIIVYREKILYANKTAIETFGYTEEELLSMSPEQLVAEEYREEVKKVIKRRLRGEEFENIYRELPVLTRDGGIRVLFIFSKTIKWKDKPAGFVIFIDITKKKRYEKFFHVLREVNQLIISAYEEEELLGKVCELLVTKAGFKMAWVGIPDPESRYIKPLKICGFDEGYVKSVKISTDESVPEGRGPTGTALREGKIIVNPDTRTNPAVQPWREQMLQRGFLSSCAIPLSRGGKTVALLNIYSAIPNMFSEEELELLEEIQKDLSFALEKIEKERFIKITNTAIEKGHEWVVITDEEGNILSVNKAVEEISGYKREELIGKNPRIFKSGYHPPEFYRKMWQTIKEGRSFQAVFVNRKKNGEIFYLDQRIVPIPVGGNKIRYVGLGNDITSERFLEERITYLKYIDIVTGLPNREGFLASVELALQRDRDLNHVLFIIDIVDFSGINQIYGTAVADKVLRYIGNILKETLFRRDIVGRVGGDEFGVLARNIAEREITALSARLLNALGETFDVEGRKIKLSVNVGASLYPKDGENAKELLEKASVALTFAKREGENTCRFFSEEINEKIKGYFKVRDELEKALQEDRFILYFQPFYYADTRSIAGFEALMRLKKKGGKVLTPKDFIFVLERTSLIKRVEDRLLEKLKSFIFRHRKKITVAMNISPKSFKDENFIKKIKRISEEVGRCLVLEITERLLVENPEYAQNFLQEVRSAGVKIAIDDFGTGYSSLAYLESLPVDILKIDMRFVHRITDSPKSLAIVETIIELARRLGIKTTAEGVETEEQLRILNELGVVYVQGFYLAKPMPPEETDLILTL